MLEQRSWSLARRLTRMFLATTLMFVVAISVASGLFLWNSVEQQVDALANEEVEETTAEFRNRPFDLDAFRKAVDTEQRRHPENAMGWRIWSKDDSSTPTEFGHVELLSQEWPSPVAARTPIRLDRWMRTATVRLADGTRIGLVIDGSAQYRRLGLYAIVVGSLVALTFAITLLVSRRFFVKVSTILRTVAQRLRAADSRTEQVELSVEGAPEEIRDVALALSETLAKIRAEMEDARVFTAGIAHELRSPVQNLIGETEVALIANREPEAYRHVLDSHLDELRRLGDAVDNLVTICSRNETSRTVEREDFDLASEAELRLRRERALAERNGVTLVLEAHGNSSLRGDREAVLRAVRNLTQNAIQWSPPGGTVTVSITGSENEVVVRVDDDGPGVPEQLRDSIFEAFFRAPSAQGRRLGFGLGLALAKTAAIEHGGRIDVESSPSGGARFTLVLPRTRIVVPA
ncbi:MAG: hypothetical protein JNL28_01960 [Planctomycetes bacterium]|nr:hypothetical protein [Planctomycetota bacterium]